jgi:transposase
MRYVKPLTQEEITLLETHYKTSAHHRERERCKALLLSNEKNNIRTLAAYFSLDPDTIHNWITRWENPLPTEKSPLERLKDAFRSGRPSLLSVEQKKK